MTGDRDSEQQRMDFNASVVIQAPTTDPLHSFISSEKYVESLESKLNKLKGKNVSEPKSKDILKSIEKVRDSQMVQLMQDVGVHSTSDSVVDYEGSVLNKDYAGKQQTKEEIAALLHHDVLAKVTSESEDTDKDHKS